MATFLNLAVNLSTDFQTIVNVSIEYGVRFILANLSCLLL